MGWYGGRRGQQLETLMRVPGRAQSAPVRQARNMVVARWQTSATLDTHGLPTGAYLVRLDASDGSQGYIPLTVRAKSTRGTVVLVSPVTTWEAYNSFGHYDLYRGVDGRFSSRARAVSFDRPYQEHFGSAAFINRELPIVAEAERLGLHLAYLTDVDLDLNPHAVDGARAVITMGHDEYWSSAMRAVVTRARDAGTNLAFFGANDMFRRIRFESSPLGSARVEVNYKIAAEDPAFYRGNRSITADWPSPPHAQPESSIIGSQYNCFRPGRAAGVVVSPASAFFNGTGVTFGTQLPRLVGPEVDRVNLLFPTPRPLQILLHSPFTCPGGRSYADTTYYTAASAAGVFAAGSESWVCAMTRTCASAKTSAIVRRISDNILRVFAIGPAGRSVKAVDNIRRFASTKRLGIPGHVL